MNLKHLTNSELHLQTVARAEHERMSTIEVLWHLRENERRMLYAEMGNQDLKEYCVKELKYSEGSAWRRISAMRLLKDMPEVEEKIQTGDLNLTQMVLAQSHFREVKSTQSEKREVLLSLENQTVKSTGRILAELKPEDLQIKPVETEKPKRGQKLEVTFILDEEMQKDLQEIAMLLGKPHSKLELFKLMTKKTLADLKKQKSRSPAASKVMPTASKANPTFSKTISTASDEVRTQDECKAQPLRRRDVPSSRQQVEISELVTKSRYVAVATRRQVDVRDQHQCQYRDPKSGRQCGARFHLQIEHIIPFAKGGGHELKNLQLLCANHNRLRAIQQFGQQKMARYLDIKRL